MNKRKIRLLGYPYIIGLSAIIIVLLPINEVTRLDILLGLSLIFFALTALYFWFVSQEFKIIEKMVPRSVRTIMAASSLGAVSLGLTLFQLNHPLLIGLLVYSLAALFFMLMYETYHEN